MKKLISVIVFFITVTAFSAAFAANDQYKNDIKLPAYSESVGLPAGAFNLPESIQVIEDEAFEGTAISDIVLPQGVTTIGERAFASIITLRSIRIPMATNQIAKSAFAGSSHAAIIAAPNSYARSWADENKLPFSPIIMMCAGAGNQSVTGFLASHSEEVPDTESSETQVTNRTWRRLEEIQVTGNIEIIANHVQGRAPPMG